MKKMIYVDGMMCAHCKKHVEEQLKKISGVISAEANVEDASATVELSMPVEDSVLKQTIIDAGYEINSKKEIKTL